MDFDKVKVTIDVRTDSTKLTPEDEVLNAAEDWAAARSALLELLSIKDPEFMKRLNALSDAEDKLARAVRKL